MPGLPCLRLTALAMMTGLGVVVLAGLGAAPAQASALGGPPTTPAPAPAAAPPSSTVPPLIDLGASAQVSLGPIGLGVCLHVAAVPGLTVQASVGVALGPLSGTAAANVSIGNPNGASACPASTSASPAPAAVPTPPVAPVTPPPPVAPPSSSAAVAAPPTAGAVAPAAGPVAPEPPARGSSGLPSRPRSPSVQRHRTPASVQVAARTPSRLRNQPSAASLLRPLERAQTTAAARGGMTNALLAMVVLAVLTTCIAAAATRFGGRPRQ